MEVLERWVPKMMLRFPTQVFLVAICCLLYLPQLDSWPLFDWDELMPAESTREMLATGNYRMVQIDYQPFYEKPPLFMWIQALSMKLFGVNEFGARFPNVVTGTLVTLLLFNIGRLFFGSAMGVWWGLLMAVGVMSQFYFRSGFIHPVYDMFTCISVYYLYRLALPDEFSPRKWIRANRRKWLALSALFAGLATLVKGPACLVVIALTATVYFFLQRGRMRIEVSEMLAWWAVVLLVVFSWLGWELYDNGLRFVEGFGAFYRKLIATPAEGHGGPVYYYVVVLLIGCFPASVLFAAGLKKYETETDAQQQFKRWMLYLLLTNLLVFSLATTKIVHYASLCTYPLTFFAAYYLYRLWEGNDKWTWKQTLPVLVMAMIFAASVFGVHFLAERRSLLLPNIRDAFAAACLMAPVYLHPYEKWIGVIFLAAIMVAILLVQSRHVRWGIYLMLMATAVFFNTLLIIWVPRAERMSQHAYIDFILSKQTERCKIETDFRGYAVLFYTRKPPAQKDDYDCYYKIARLPRAGAVAAADTMLRELYRQNGYVFFERGRK
ncbi:MAG: glycosyltransferase family 39 protein [Chitinophagales bacterium]|nr:glycosyltransferase family 39 protein [Chitinophagales bacterium]MDW8418791.1 glycosyltransferase family 39 protein [Chitinophagales bacterium]